MKLPFMPTDARHEVDGGRDDEPAVGDREGEAPRPVAENPRALLGVAQLREVTWHGQARQIAPGEGSGGHQRPPSIVEVILESASTILLAGCVVKTAA
jgi:hypothetical protein